MNAAANAAFFDPAQVDATFHPLSLRPEPTSYAAADMASHAPSFDAAFAAFSNAFQTSAATYAAFYAASSNALLTNAAAYVATSTGIWLVILPPSMLLIRPLQPLLMLFRPVQLLMLLLPVLLTEIWLLILPPFPILLTKELWLLIL